MQPTVKVKCNRSLHRKSFFLSFMEISERNGSLCSSHSGSLWLSLAQKALARLATSQLHSSSLSHSGTDMWFLALKFSHYPSRPVPLPELFVTTRPDPVPKSKTTTRQSLVLSVRLRFNGCGQTPLTWVRVASPRLLPVLWTLTNQIWVNHFGNS